MITIMTSEKSWLSTHPVVRRVSYCLVRKLNLSRYLTLTGDQRSELLQVLDKYPRVFSDIPGLCTLVQHEIPIASGFRPKRLKAYRVPEFCKPEVNRQIAELLRLGFIEPSSSPMASPIACVN